MDLLLAHKVGTVDVQVDGRNLDDKIEPGIAVTDTYPEKLLLELVVMGTQHNGPKLIVFAAKSGRRGVRNYDFV